MIVDRLRALLAHAFKLSIVSLAGVCLITPAALAQDAAAEEETDRDESIEEIVTTGSRIKRDTYSSISPLQVISGQVSREIGSIDPSTILQETTNAAGQQIDITYQGFVLPNGPGTSTIDLRGLGDARTLVLINGRRAAPVGVEGAPFAADLNVIPASLVDRYEILTDGASSIYGSDAIAGVANIILRKDFEGFEFEAYSQLPDYDEGMVNTVNAAWGYTGDRGFFGIAADYSKGERVTRGDRPWSAGCTNPIEMDQDGNVYETNTYYQRLYGMKESNCLPIWGQRVFDNEVGLFGSLYWTSGTSNVGIPNLSEANFDFYVFDSNGDGVSDVDFTDYWTESESDVSDLFPERERLSVMSYGEYTFEGEMNITPYFEYNYNSRDIEAYSTPLRLQGINDINVPGDNPYNPCNPDGIDGVDCWVAYDNMVTDPVLVEAWRDNYEALCARFGFTREQCTPQLFGLGPYGITGGLSLEAEVAVRGDTDFVFTDIEQHRLVAGVRGDLPQIDFGSLDNWSFDVSVVHSESSGDSLRSGVVEERLLYSINTSVIDPNTGQVVCGTDTNGDGIPDSGDCVPVDMFAPSLFAGLTNNDFATQAERDYLFADRTFATDYTQTLFSLTFAGDLFSLPGGEAAAAIGYEYRRDEIDSIPNEVAAEGQLVGFFRDLGAVGEKDTEEIFAEVELPLFAGYAGMRELTVNLASRYTKDEFYGGAWTYSAKLGYRPIDSLLIKATAGTSYRAPNLRENFLLGTSGFLGLNDPCVTPDEALFDEPGGGIVYDPEFDTRDDVVLQNCIAQGVDPTNLGIINSGATQTSYSVEILRGVGLTDLDEEESNSFTAGFAWDQPFWSSFDMTLGATYYEVEVTQEIIQLSPGGVVNGCYTDAELDSPYCSLIERNLDGDGLMVLVSGSFLNRDQLRARGVDVNLSIDWPTQMFGRAVDLSADLNFNRKLEISSKITDDVTGDVSTDSDLGQFGFPEWEGQGIFRADVGKYRLTWSTRYFGSMRPDTDTRAFYDYGSFSWGCPDDVLCRPVGEADNYFRHDMSIYYLGDTWTFGAGIRNVQNEPPPRVDYRPVFSDFNTPFGAGYDLNGRSYFVNIGARFQ
jgi:iron complex outermembrane receptor protein